jgi:transcriptional regulator with XRE-family HTH domain
MHARGEQSKGNGTSLFRAANGQTFRIRHRRCGDVVPGNSAAHVWTSASFVHSRWNRHRLVSASCDGRAMGSESGITIGGYPLTGIIRRVRRQADFSQRELAKYAQVSPSALAAFETGRRTPSLATLQRIFNAANFLLVAADAEGRLVVPLEVWQDTYDGAGRRYPAHLDTILDPVFGEWWADGYGLARPPETFRRNRAFRDYQRRMSRLDVREHGAMLGGHPPLPPGWKPGDEWRPD